MQSLKIALVVPGGFDRPGAPEPERAIPALHALVRHLSAAHEVHVFCTDFDERGGEWSRLGAEIHDPGKVPPSRLPLQRTIERARRLFLALRAASARAPFQVMHAFWVDGNGAAAAMCAAALQLPFVASVGGGECVSLPAIGYGNARFASQRLATRLVLARANVVTVGSAQARNQVPAAGVFVIPLGAERSAFEAARARAAGPPWRLIHVANQNAVKDPWTTLDAFHRLAKSDQDITLDWFGMDTLEGTVTARARSLGLSTRITFHGAAEHTIIARALRSAHLHIVSSHHESQCVAVLEAALAGVPTVGTRVGLVADLAPHAAIAVPVGDAEALAAAVQSTLMDTQRRDELAHAAQQYALANDATSTASRFEALYEEARRLHSSKR